MTASLTPGQIADWREFYEQFPFGDSWQQLGLARIAYVCALAGGSKSANLEMFLPFQTEPPETVDSLKWADSMLQSTADGRELLKQMRGQNGSSAKT